MCTYWNLLIHPNSLVIWEFLWAFFYTSFSDFTHVSVHVNCWNIFPYEYYKFSQVNILSLFKKLLRTQSMALSEVPAVQTWGLEFRASELIKIKAHTCNWRCGRNGRFLNLTYQTNETRAHWETSSQQMMGQTIHEKDQMPTSGFNMHMHTHTNTPTYVPQ